MHTKKHLITGGLLTGAVSLMLLAPAQAQYRTGVPDVLTPPAAQVMEDPNKAVRSEFRRAYAQNKRPRIVVFWNRKFTDEVASQYEEYERNRSTSQTNRIVSGQGFDIPNEENQT